MNLHHQIFHDIGWAPFIVGFFYGTALGHFFVQKVVQQMRKHVDADPGMPWQAAVTGIIERTLYMISFLVGKPGFVAVWLAFKVAARWKGWTGGHLERAAYMNVVNGSALSILYAGVGYLIIVWWDREAALIGGILVWLTLVLWVILYVQQLRMGGHDVD